MNNIISNLKYITTPIPKATTPSHPCQLHEAEGKTSARG